VKRRGDDLLKGMVIGFCLGLVVGFLMRGCNALNY
jgi:hypothetical protein